MTKALSAAAISYGFFDNSNNKSVDVDMFELWATFGNGSGVELYEVLLVYADISNSLSILLPTHGVWVYEVDEVFGAALREHIIKEKTYDDEAMKRKLGEIVYEVVTRNEKDLRTIMQMANLVMLAIGYGGPK